MEEYLKLIPTTASLISAYSSISTSLVLFKTAYNQVMPKQLQEYAVSKFRYCFSRSASYATFIIEDFWCGLGRNQLYDAARAYLSTKIGPRNLKIKVGKLEQHKNVSAAIVEGGKIVDVFQGIAIIWWCVQEEQVTNICNTKKGKEYMMPQAPSRSSYKITFDNRYRGTVQNDYLIHVLDTSEALTQGEKVLKLYSRLDRYHESERWKSVEFRHPATFDTIAMDLELKKAIVDDLDRFLASKEFYRRVGKAWKRGYLLYGPPGTGKSSLIAAMANYLNFDIYDLELSSISSSVDLRRVLLNTTNRSILVVEDIDCNSEVRNWCRPMNEEHPVPLNYANPLPLSSLLNCIDGLWSSCGEARIIVFTTNHREVLDPALLRPGRMDMHIHMSYCTTQGFRVLAFNYLGIHDHKLYQEIDELVESTKVTPASLAEELMKSDDADLALGEVVNFLKRKKMEEDQTKEKNKRQRTE
ncbi:hypothetical protein P3X46_014170 [Hevea brasiliensis]|uniref:AAA+ ATPase domain-containing protein n=1 Tax=Hevea brasiliensis TaxID=3981 RepID=A0ABQ9M853_HEVBR|nr:AAA-ATPase At3g50940-like [Hevea brasiliensis]KAJ9175632.1 hypothetical protein P3X46_014170 [Hevea brasiliensis]